MTVLIAAHLNISDVNIHPLFESLKISILLNAKYNIYSLKKCFENGIPFGLNCKESNVLYSMIYHLLQADIIGNNDKNNNISYNWDTGKRIYTAMTILWYTQGTIENHHCYECNTSWIDHIIKYQRSDTSDTIATGNTNSTSDDLDASRMIKETIDELVLKYIPETIAVNFEDSGSHELYKQTTMTLTIEIVWIAVIALNMNSNIMQTNTLNHYLHRLIVD